MAGWLDPESGGGGDLGSVIVDSILLESGNKGRTFCLRAIVTVRNEGNEPVSNAKTDQRPTKQSSKSGPPV